jgi:hypothetical protein
MKVISYYYDDLSGIYVPMQHGSAVYMWNNIIFTNAHVILDEQNKPIGNYEVCKTIDFRETPQCFSLWELLYYDEKKDLAALRITNPEVPSVTYASKKITIWDIVKVYGYPSNGWDTISYTEWKISWYEKWLYKIDANIDAGNSWWGVFDEDGNLIWIAVSVVVWYTTMWYIVPINDIELFESQQWQITSYTSPTDTWFKKYLSSLHAMRKSDHITNQYIDISSLSKYWFQAEHFFIDTTKKYFNIVLNNEEVSVSIANFSTLGAVTTIESFFINMQKQLQAQQQQKNIKKYYAKKITYQERDAIITYIVWSANEFILLYTIELASQQYISITISADSIQYKELAKAYYMIENGLKITSTDLSGPLQYETFDNLQIWPVAPFFIAKEVTGDHLRIHHDDIEVVNSTVSDEEKWFVWNDLYEILYTIYDYTQDIFDYKQALIKQNQHGIYYIYLLYEHRELHVKKYTLDVYMYHEKNADMVYENNFEFAFDSMDSLPVIEWLLDQIQPSWKQSYMLWSGVLNQNIVDQWWSSPQTLIQ